MTCGFAPAVADNILNGLLRSAAGVTIQLHVGDPGADGMDNLAANDIRQGIAFDAASGGAIVSSVEVGWPPVPATETYTHFSLWDTKGAGHFLVSGMLNASEVPEGERFTIAPGAASVVLNVAETSE